MSQRSNSQKQHILQHVKIPSAAFNARDVGPPSGVSHPMRCGSGTLFKCLGRECSQVTPQLTSAPPPPSPPPAFLQLTQRSRWHRGSSLFFVGSTPILRHPRLIVPSEIRPRHSYPFHVSRTLFLLIYITHPSTFVFLSTAVCPTSVRSTRHHHNPHLKLLQLSQWVVSASILYTETPALFHANSTATQTALERLTQLGGQFTAGGKDKILQKNADDVGSPCPPFSSVPSV